VLAAPASAGRGCVGRFNDFAGSAFAANESDDRESKESGSQDFFYHRLLPIS
jgi:hypothetical protein